MKQNLGTLEDYIKMFCYLFTLFFPAGFGLCSAVIVSNVAVCQYHVHHNIANACI